MTDPAGPPGFGDPATVERIASAARQTASELDKLIDQVNSDVSATVPDRWGGQAASAFTQMLYRFSAAIAGMGSPMDTYAQELARAAETMRQARQELDAARQYARANMLYLLPDLTVIALNPNQADAQAQVQVCQRMVNLARVRASQAQQQIRDANATLDAAAERAQRELIEILAVTMMSGGGRGGRRRQGRLTTAERAYEGTARVPAANRGEWIQGDPNGGVWRPHQPGAYGLQWPRDTIRWQEGVPNLREHTVPPRDMSGQSGVLDNLRGLNGRYANDMAIADGELAARFGPGWNAERVAAWRQQNDYVWHHYSNSELQLVPGRIHRPLYHQGSASDLRWP